MAAIKILSLLLILCPILSFGQKSIYPKDTIYVKYQEKNNAAWNAFFILENIISEIALALKEFGQKQGYNLSNQFYSDMAWGGLTHIKDPSNTNNYILNPIFKEAVPNQTDQQRILNTLSAEQLSQTVNGIAPKGVQVCP